jgi:hypothetical protein
MRKPQPPFENVEDARERILDGSSAKDRIWIMEIDGWPCPDCHGSGQLYDRNDPYEGVKLADLERCPKCDGHGIISKCAFTQWYDDWMSPYRKLLDCYIQLELEVRRIFEKLTENEIQTLAEWFGAT